MNTYKPTTTFLVFLLLLTTSSIASCKSSQASYLRPFIQFLADSLSRGDIEGPNLNMMGHEPIYSQQYRRYVTLKDSATIEELAQLTNHPSAVVRCYAFDALSALKAPNFFELVQSHLTDSAKVRIHFFDMISYEKVSDYLKRGSLRYFFETGKPDNAQYSFVRSLATTKEVPEAIIALARFRKSGDEAVILSYLGDARLRILGVTAVREFPSEQFFQKLVQLHKEVLDQDIPSLSICVPLYEALVQFRSPQILSILSESITEPKEFAASIHKISVYVALKKHPDNFFNEVINKIKLSPFEIEGANELLKE